MSQSRSPGRLPSCPNYLEPPVLVGCKVNERDVAGIKNVWLGGVREKYYNQRTERAEEEERRVLGERVYGSEVFSGKRQK